jgi:NTP pyrophosphatase (non-canonical NTP hydrolase)
MNELIEKVKQWGLEKGITGPAGRGTLLKQLSKTQEELTEARDAAIKYGIWPNPIEARIELKDGIGDCTVTLILAAELAGLDFENCLLHAYNEIKGRTGTMIGGQFVKDS